MLIVITKKDGNYFIQFLSVIFFFLNQIKKTAKIAKTRFFYVNDLKN